MLEVVTNTPTSLKCCFFDDRTEFFQAISEKLGSNFLLVPVDSDNRQLLRECDAIIVGIATSNDTRSQDRLAVLNEVVRHAGPTPVIAFLSTTDRQLMRAVVGAGAYDFFVETGSMEELRIVLRRAAQFHELILEIERLKCSTWNNSDFS